MGPSPPTPSTPGHLVHQLIWEMDHLPLQLINQPPAVSEAEKVYNDVYNFVLQEGGSIIIALANLLQLMLTYCRSQLSTLTGITVL